MNEGAIAVALLFLFVFMWVWLVRMVRDRLLGGRR
jgi:hypothetical protein